MALILANDGIDPSAKEQLEAMGHIVDIKKYEGEELLARLKEVDCIIIRSATRMDREQLEAGKAGGKLKLVLRAGVGLDNVDLIHAQQLGIDVSNTPTASSNAVAELALGQMFSLSRHLYAAGISMREGKWLKKAYQGVELTGKTLGLYGFGRIAKLLGKKAKALGMQVIYTNRSGPRADADFRYVSKEELLAESDYISLHVPFAGGQALIGPEEFQRMKEGVFLINTSRGGVVDEEALLTAIQSGKVAAAALDVFAKEPLDQESLRQCEKIALTPHIGASTMEAQERIGGNLVDLIAERL